jgi:hypothetical protein
MNNHCVETAMETADDLLSQLQLSGVLLHHDTLLLSLTTLVAGEPVAGSWWAHPHAQQIYALLNTLAAHPDVLVVKLVLGKVTFIHRRLWPALLAVACAGESWQVAKLSDAARALYEAVERHGMVQAAGAAPKELERRLLVQSTQMHTEAGRHEMQLTQWTLWAQQVKCEPALTATAGRFQLEAAVQAVGGTQRMLPWKAKTVAE